MGTGLQEVNYAYNIRGWMTQINDPSNLGITDLFGYKIRYTNPEYTSLASGRYNGNIAEVNWKTAKDGILKKYSYQYDALNRLQSGLYSEPDASVPQNGYYNETLSYDLNGNIKNLQRNRLLQNFGAQQMDNLTYVYTGNQLNTVTDSSSDYSGYPDSSGSLIHYDPNGNMIDHVDRAILQISYNHLNLPNYIKFDLFVIRNDPFTGGTSTIYKNTKYVYRADGVKQSKIHNYFSGRIQGDSYVSTEYLDSFQYNYDFSGLAASLSPQGLQFVSTSEGYYDFVQNKYIYQYKDQVGNIRVSFYKEALGNTVIDRTNDYYPFGLEFGGPVSTNTNTSVSPNYTYTFQEQEKQQETGWNSFKWRNYDPAMGRFFNVDPLSEKYNIWSHYSFSGNRVVDARELEGLEPVLPYNSLDEAAENFAQQYNGVSIINSIELTTDLYSFKKDGKIFYSYSQPVGYLELDKNGDRIPGTSAIADIDIPEGSKREAGIHTHGADLFKRLKNYTTNDNDFSDWDKNLARGNGDWSKRQTQYVVTPNGLLLVYDPELNAPKDRKGGAVKTNKPIPSDPLSVTRKNNVSPEVKPVVAPAVFDNNGKPVELDSKFKENKKLP